MSFDEAFFLLQWMFPYASGVFEIRKTYYQNGNREIKLKHTYRRSRSLTYFMRVSASSGKAVHPRERIKKELLETEKKKRELIPSSTASDATSSGCAPSIAASARSTVGRRRSGWSRIGTSARRGRSLLITWCGCARGSTSII